MLIVAGQRVRPHSSIEQDGRLHTRRVQSVVLKALLTSCFLYSDYIMASLCSKVDMSSPLYVTTCLRQKMNAKTVNRIEYYSNIILLNASSIEC